MLAEQTRGRVGQDKARAVVGKLPVVVDIEVDIGVRTLVEGKELALSGAVVGTIALVEVGRQLMSSSK